MDIFKPRFKNRLGEYQEATNYALRFTQNGKRIVKGLGTANKAAAEARARKIISAAKLDGWAALKPKLPGRNKVTIDELIASYRLFAPAGGPKGRSLSPRTVRANVDALKRIAGSLGVVTVADLVGKVGSWQPSGSQGEVTRHATMRMARSLFSKRAMDWYVEQSLSVPNPFDSVKVTAPEMARFPGFERDRVRTLIGDAKRELREKDADAYVIFLLTLGAGLRAQEATWAQKSHLHDDHVVVVSDPKTHRTKNRLTRTVHIPVSLSKEIRVASTSRSQYLVGTQRTRVGPHEIRGEKPLRRLAEWLRLHGVDQPKPVHFLRGIFGSVAVTELSTFHAKEYLGHSTIAVTEQHYAALLDQPACDVFAMGGPKPKKKK